MLAYRSMRLRSVRGYSVLANNGAEVATPRRATVGDPMRPLRWVSKSHAKRRYCNKSSNLGMLLLAI